MKRIILLLLGFILSACAIPIDPNIAYQRALTSSVMIHGEDGSLGSGVIINSNCALTAKHVVSPQKQEILTQDGKWHPVSKAIPAEFADIAAVCSEDHLGYPVLIRRTMPARYSPVFQIGNPLGERNILTTGLYQGDDNYTAQTAPGNSGGGIFDETGALIGITMAIRVSHIEEYVFLYPHLAVMTTIRDIIPFLETNLISFSAQ